MSFVDLWDPATGRIVPTPAREVQIRNLRVGQRYYVTDGGVPRTRPETHTCAMTYHGIVNGLLEFNWPNQVYVPIEHARVYSTRYAR